MHRQAMNGLAADSCPADYQPELTAKQEAECRFNENKLQMAKVEALLADHLTPSEVTPELIAEAEALTARLAKNQRERATATARVRRLLSKPVDPGLEIANIWHESGQLDGVYAHAPKAPRRADASTFVVEDPAHVGHDTTIICGLVGGALAATASAVVAFRRGLGIQRFLHITMPFMQAHLDLCDEIWHLLRGQGVKWQLYSENDIEACLKSDPLAAGERGGRGDGCSRTWLDARVHSPGPPGEEHQGPSGQ